MAETSFTIRSFRVLTIRLEPTDVRGAGSPARPTLRLPLKLQVKPTRGQQGDIDYALLRLAGTLSSPAIGDFAEFEVGPIVEESRNDAHYIRGLDVQVDLNHPRVRQFEDARSGANAQLSVNLSGLVWFPEDQKFEKAHSDSPLQVVVPRSHWADEVLSRWGLGTVKLIEVKFPSSDVGQNYLRAYSQVENAERLSASGQYKQALAELYSAFENVANSQGFSKPDQQYFAQVFADVHPMKKEAAKRALDGLCDFLHLGRHEPKESPETFQISRCDARFALTMAHAVFEYVTPKR
jgi:hypothetical protein